MPRYVFTGEIDTFPPVRDALELAGVFVLAVTTEDNVLHVETQDAIAEPEPYLLTEV